jgi:cytochrome c-type biogenesis protein CcmE
VSVPRTKLIVGSILLIGALSYLAVAAVRSGWVYYVGVDELVTESGLQRGRVRVHGVVAALEPGVRDGSGETWFELRGRERCLRVRHRGQLPDTFAAGREAVVEGRLSTDGCFEADLVLTKCASKYEARAAGTEPVLTGETAKEQRP